MEITDWPDPLEIKQSEPERFFFHTIWEMGSSCEHVAAGTFTVPADRTLVITDFMHLRSTTGVPTTFVFPGGRIITDEVISPTTGIEVAAGGVVTVRGTGISGCAGAAGDAAFSGVLRDT